MKIKFKKLYDAAQTPLHATAGSAGLDLYCTTHTEDFQKGTISYKTGIAVEIPRGYAGLLFPRSSVCKTSVRLTNCVGVIDSDYRGEISAVFDRKNIPAPVYQMGERIAQLIIVPVPEIELEEADELSDTARGSGGYGSTGAR